MKRSVLGVALAMAMLVASSASFAAQTDQTSQANPKHGVTLHAGDSKDTAKAEATPAECTALQGRFDTAIKTHQSNPGAAKAKDLRAEGGKLCAAGKTAEGVKKLEEALGDIGQKGVKSVN